MISAVVLPTIQKIHLPTRYHLHISDNRMIIERILSRAMELNVRVLPYKSRGENCRRLLAQVSDGKKFILEFASFRDSYGGDIEGAVRYHNATVRNGVLVAEKAYFRDQHLVGQGATDIRDAVYNAWQAGIRYLPELRDSNGILRNGFRKPQLGALHAIASHWTVTSDPAVVVMPTGTGKTEVMIASAIAACSRRVLIVVPTDALRYQTAIKFQSYGILHALGVIEDLPLPVVARLTSRLNETHIDQLGLCNVVIATMSSIGLAQDDIQRRFAECFSHIYFDEAHHIEAATWKRFKHYCKHAHVVLLTATPFREDGKALEGKIIYNFPLATAQELGYFQKIHFSEVFEPDERRANRCIAEVAVSKLRSDLDAGYNHILMARTNSIDEANLLYENIYRPLYSELNPVVIHSRTPQKSKVMKSIREGQHRIVICVDMFGEGFDLPSLKIAALHRVQKSLGITLQFIGRFARTSDAVGQATFVANTAEDGVPEALESLYQEDADWNVLLPDLSYDAIDPQTKLSELVTGLQSAQVEKTDSQVSLLTLRPKISAQVYRTTEFNPKRFIKAFRPSQRIVQAHISRRDNFLIFIVNQRESIEWADSRDITLDEWNLYLAYFEPEKQLLYIHSSRKGDSTSRLAEKISVEPVLIQEEETFKVFSGLRRLTLHNVGLLGRSRNVRYQMFAGLDVRNAIDPAQQQSKRKSNITGVGYEDGKRQSIGCSRKGKIWSIRSGTLAEWRDWCHGVGNKLSNISVSPNDFFQYTLVPSSISQLPSVRAVMADWPDQLFEAAHFRFEVLVDNQRFEFADCQIDLLSWDVNGNSFQFRLRAGTELETILCLRLVVRQSEEDYEVVRLSGPDLLIETGSRRWSVSEYFNENAPLVRFADGSQLSGNLLLKPRSEITDAFERNSIQTIDWRGVDIKKESRWKDNALRADSIQQCFIEHLERSDAAFLIDDDDTGESADIVAIEETDNKIVIYLWHCKYASGNEPGPRVDDLYEVCGQAQKSVKWTWNLKTLIKHLINREAKYKRGRPSRFVRGTPAELISLRKAARRKFVEYKIGIVQPGLSKAAISTDLLAILGATNNFIQCVTDHPLLVITNR